MLLFSMGLSSGIGTTTVTQGFTNEDGWTIFGMYCPPYENSDCSNVSVQPGNLATDTVNQKEITSACAAAQGKTVDNMASCTLWKGDAVCLPPDGPNAKNFKNAAGSPRSCSW